MELTSSEQSSVGGATPSLADILVQQGIVTQAIRETVEWYRYAACDGADIASFTQSQIAAFMTAATSNPAHP